MNKRQRKKKLKKNMESWWKEIPIKTQGTMALAEMRALWMQLTREK